MRQGGVALDQLTRPAHLWVPESACSSAGAEAADLAEAIGLTLDAEQRLVLDAMLSETAEGKWAALEAAVICGRQNLKTFCLIVSVLHDLFLRDTRLVIWSAHRFRTAQEAHRDIVALVDGSDMLRRRVKKIRNANGEEGIELTSGARIDFAARTSSGATGRGLSGDVVVLDEALYLTPTMMGALLPTLSARPDPQVRYGSSAGLLDSEVLRSIRDRGRAGGDPSLAYVEWSTDRGGCPSNCDHSVGSQGCALDNVDLWAQANPALGRRITVDYLSAERRALPPREFARERLGWWEDPPDADADRVIPESSWASRLDASSRVPDGSAVTFAIDTSWDRLTTWIAVCAARADGVPHVEVVAHDFGSDWVLGWLKERVASYKPKAIGLQASGAPVSSLLEPLKREFGDVVTGMTGQDLGRACGMFYDAVTSGPLAHLGQHQLDQAVRHAVVRPMSDSWLWDRKVSPVDVAPLVAVTGALYLLNTAPEPKRRSGRVAGF